MILIDPLLPGLSLVGWARVRVDVVRVDVEGDQAQSLKWWRIDDGHVVGRVDAHGGDVGAGTGPNVGDSFLKNLSVKDKKIVKMK